MSLRRGVDAPRAGGGRTTPDALVAAVPVAMELVRRIDAAVSVAGRPAPLAVLLVIDVLVYLLGTVDTAMPVARRSAMPAFRAHDVLLNEQTPSQSVRHQIPYLVSQHHNLGFTLFGTRLHLERRRGFQSDDGHGDRQEVPHGD